MSASQPAAAEPPADAQAASAARKKLRAAAWPARLAALVLGVCVVGFWVWWAITEPVWFGVFVAYLAIVIVAVLLADRYPWIKRVGRAAATAFGVFFVSCVVLLVLLLPLVVFRALANAAVGTPLGLGVPLVVAWSVLYLACVYQLWTEDGRRRIATAGRGLSRLAPFFVAFVVAQIAIILFATLAAMLARHGAIEFKKPVSEPSDALDFFLWHFLDAIPGLDVTTTLRWGEPLGYEDTGVGWLLLAFKVFAIVPIIGAFVAFARQRPREQPAVAP